MNEATIRVKCDMLRTELEKEARNAAEAGEEPKADATMMLCLDLLEGTLINLSRLANSKR